MTNPLSSLAQRTARWCALHPWRAVLGWVALVALAVGLAAMVPTQGTTDADYRMGESGRADALYAGAGFDDPDVEQVLVTGGDEAARSAAAAEVVASMTALPQVDEVAGPQASPDGSAQLVSVTLARDQDDPAALEAVTAAVQADHPDLQVRETGDLSLDRAVDERVEADLSSSETLSLPITLLLMVLAFGALIAAGIPVLLAGSSVVVTRRAAGARSRTWCTSTAPSRPWSCSSAWPWASTTRCSSSSASARSAPPATPRSTPSRSPPAPRVTRSWSPASPSSARWPGCS